MKRLFFPALFLVFTNVVFSAEGPTKRGGMIIDGSFSYMSQRGDLYENSSGEGSSTISATPRLEYFVTNGLAVGGSLQFERQSQGGSLRSFAGVGPTISYYFDIASSFDGGTGALYPFLRATFFVGTSWREKKANALNMKQLTLQGTAGLTYMLSKAIGATFGLTIRQEELSFTDSSPIYGNIDFEASGTSMIIGLGVTAFLF